MGMATPLRRNRSIVARCPAAPSDAMAKFHCVGLGFRSGDDIGQFSLRALPLS